MFTLGGVLPPRGDKGWRFLLSTGHGNRLRFGGVIELGISRAALARLEETGQRLVTTECPFIGRCMKDAFFYEPELYAMIQYLTGRMAAYLEKHALSVSCHKD